MAPQPTPIGHDARPHSAREWEVLVNRDLAMHVCDHHPAIHIGMRVAHQFWGWVGLVVLFGVPVYGLWTWQWEWVVGGLIVGMMIIQATRKSACSFVRETARENDAFRDEMIASGVLIYRPKG